jgi:hypothetical protein
MKTILLTSQAIDFLEKWDASHTDAQFACLNPHWWMGKDSDGYWWAYSDADDFDDPDYNDYERVDNSRDLRERFADIEDEWALLPQPRKDPPEPRARGAGSGALERAA